MSVPNPHIRFNQPAESTDMPATPHQTQALEDIEKRFKQMDTDGDGQISQEEGNQNTGLSEQ